MALNTSEALWMLTQVLLIAEPHGDFEVGAMPAISIRPPRGVA